MATPFHPRRGSTDSQSSQMSSHSSFGSLNIYGSGEGARVITTASPPPRPSSSSSARRGSLSASGPSSSPSSVEPASSSAATSGVPSFASTSPYSPSSSGRARGRPDSWSGITRGPSASPMHFVTSYRKAYTPPAEVTSYSSGTIVASFQGTTAVHKRLDLAAADSSFDSSTRAAEPYTYRSPAKLPIASRAGGTTSASPQYHKVALEPDGDLPVAVPSHDRSVKVGTIKAGRLGYTSAAAPVTSPSGNRSSGVSSEGASPSGASSSPSFPSKYNSHTIRARSKPGLTSASFKDPKYY